MVMAWLTLILAAILVGVIVVRWTLADKEISAVEAVDVAHVQAARQHPRFRKRLQVFQGVLAVALVVLIVAGLIGAYLSGRPKEDSTLESELATRDIVLCLDVSGSVIEFDGEVLASFEELIDDFQGERVGLVVWNAGARTIFPLTDDYDMVFSQLEAAQRALEVDFYVGDAYPKNEDEYFQFVSGTEVGASYGSSLIGDGLASCTFSFDLADQERSRTIILATDNGLAGNPVYQIEEATKLANSKGITVHGLYIDVGFGADGDTMQEALESEGGYFYEADDPSAAEQIIADVQSQDAKDLGAVAELVSADQPGWWPVVMSICLGIFLVLAWRYRL